MSIRANFCNLTDSVPRPIFSSCLAAQSPEMQEEWITRELLAGGTHYVFSIQAGYTDYPPEVNFYLEGRMAEWLTTLDRVLAAGLIPVVFLHTGGDYPGDQYFRNVLASIPSSYYDRALWVPAWEPVKGAWSSRQFRDAALTMRAALGPTAPMAAHLSQGRLSFASNPVEADDPWGGNEMDCWRTGWGPAGHPFDVFLYQSYVVAQGDTMDVTKPDSWGERAKEVADRVLGLPGAPDWFAGIRRPDLVWFEATAYYFIRGRSTSAWAQEVAASAQTLGYQGFGNGLPKSDTTPTPPDGGGDMQPYNEDLVFQTNEKVKDTYAEAGRSIDAQYPIWIARTVYDYCAGMSWNASESKHLAELRDALGLPAPPVPPISLLPRLVVNGQMFGLETGERWTAIQNSDFNLLNRWQHGEDIYPVLEQRAKVGFNLLRVWTLYDLVNIGTFTDIDYSRIPDFLQECSRYGLYVEFTAYTSLERKDHWDKLVAACQGPSNVLTELVNEGTLPVNQIDMARYARPSGVLASHGSGGSEGVPPWDPWDYVTFHTNGASEEQRKIGHNAWEIWSGPTLTNETSRYPEVGMWVGASLERQKQLAYDSAAGAALLCAGSCFHSVHGKTSELWDANELAVADAWVRGAKSVSLACQPGAYYRRDDLLTDELLRVYQRGTSGCIVEIHK